MTTWPLYSKEEIDAVSSVLLSGKVNYWTGENCKKFESEYADYCNTKYAVSLMNGSLALEVALRSIGIMNNDEVIVTSRTFIASVSAVINVGAQAHMPSSSQLCEVYPPSNCLALLFVRSSCQRPLPDARL